MNGLDLVKCLRNRDISAPMILITGSQDETIADRAASAGVLHVLRKPLLDESLIGHIRGVLAERSTRH
jgi:FixJ family two-component response regulator